MNLISFESSGHSQSVTFRKIFGNFTAVSDITRILRQSPWIRLYYRIRSVCNVFRCYNKDTR